MIAALSEHVRFYRTTDEGISILAEIILKKKDVKFLRKMAQRGLLDNEPRDELLAFAAREQNGAACRAALLALPPTPPDAAPHGTAPDGARTWSARLERMGEDGRQAWVREAWERPLDQRACRERIVALHSMNCYAKEDGDDWEDEFWHDIRPVTDGMWQESLDNMEFNSLTAAACCGRNPELLRALLTLRDADCVQGRSVHLSWPRKEGGFVPSALLNGTALCAAAAAGRTEQVRILLECGADANERDLSYRSVYTDGGWLGSPYVVVTPLYMALKRGWTETAQLLREHGGVAWPPRDVADRKEDESNERKEGRNE